MIDQTKRTTAWQRCGRIGHGGAIILALGVAGTLGVAAVEPCETCCGQDWGDGGHGVAVLTVDTVLAGAKEYEELTIQPGVTLDTGGFEVRVCGTLTNMGTITDIANGGHGGDGGLRGLGADPLDNDSGSCGARQTTCSAGAAGAQGFAGSNGGGNGGHGGCGGGGGGGAKTAADSHDASGGNGGSGGAGGAGGGRVRLIVFRLDNQGVIHADGADGDPGEDAPNKDETCGAEYVQIGDVSPFDLAGGGGGGGDGGDGGNGGFLEITYAHLINQGTVSANGGSGGAGGAGGTGGGNLQYGVAGSSTSGCESGCGAMLDGRGGNGAHENGETGRPGFAGAAGAHGAHGTATLSQDIGVDCNGNGNPDECDLACGASLDCNGNGIPDECDAADGPDCNGNGVPDECEPDTNGNGIPDVCEMEPDLDMGTTRTNTPQPQPQPNMGTRRAPASAGITDVIAVIEHWGPCPADCPWDLTGDGQVDFADLLLVLAIWGS